MRARALAVLMGACILGAALTSCSDAFFPDRPDVEIGLDFYPRTQSQPLALPLTLRVALGSRTYQVVVDSEFASRGIDVPVLRDGTLPVQLYLIDATGDTLATASFAQQARTNYANWILGTVATSPPLSVCLGNPEYAVGIPLAGGVSFYVDHGSWAKDVIC